ncbi:hypothetical protein N0V94_001047 [Neodidymelliopsis sp. IMI 364377]|nr:hypothetical protein N0V94_001047 [Neodidymelliopsis sp. IMI 364377]
MKYEYIKLREASDPEDTWIRLVQLLPEPNIAAEPVRCGIIEVLLSEAPSYEAVSYCWGPRIDTGTIHIMNPSAHCDNTQTTPTLTVPRSLIPFLRRSRWKKDTRLLWIDAICINQEDDEEKTLQVQKMRDIYIKAMRTLCWLGPHADGSANAIKYAESLNKLFRRKLAETGVVELLEFEKKEGVASFEMKVRLGDPDLEALLQLLNRPYFERAWIVQECIVSTNVWFVVGDSATSWHIFFGAYWYLLNFQTWLFEVYPSQRLVFVVPLRYGELDWEAGKDVEWWRVLLRQRPCLSSDPKDKVYAYYGLRCKADFQKMDISPDYVNKSIEELYIQLASRALEVLRHAEVFNVPKLVEGPEQKQDADWEPLDLPSWVPDWRYTDNTPTSLLGAEYGTADAKSTEEDNNATNGATLDVELISLKQDNNGLRNESQFPTLLRVRGYTVARITQLSPHAWKLQKPAGRYTLLEQARVLQENQIQIAEWELVLQPLDATLLYAPTNETFTTAIVETLTVGNSSFAQEQKLAAYRGYESRQRFLRNLARLDLHRFIVMYWVVVLIERVFRYLGFANPEWQFRTMATLTTNRKCARAISHSDIEPVLEYLGLVPGLCRLGDHVVLVQGVRLPLILRRKGNCEIPVGDNGSKRVETWELIGDAYIHGLMKGDKWDEEKSSDIWIA